MHKVFCPFRLTPKKIGVTGWIYFELMHDVPGVVKTLVKLPLGSSDHWAISFNVELRSSVPNVQFSRLVYFKNWTAVNRDLDGIQ